MALTPEEIKKIAEEIDKIREEKDLPVFSDDDLKRAQSLLKALKDANSSIEDLAKNQLEYGETASEVINKIKKEYGDQYAFLTESEKKIEVERRTRAAALEAIKKKEEEVFNRIVELEKQEIGLLEKGQEILKESREEQEKIAQQKKQILGSELQDLETINDIIQERGKSEQKIAKLKEESADAFRRATQGQKTNIKQIEDQLALEQEKLNRLEKALRIESRFQEDEKERQQQAYDLGMGRLKIDEQRKKLQNEIYIDLSKQLAETEKLAEIDEKRAKFGKEHESAINNSITKMTGLKDSTGGFLDVLIEAAAKDEEMNDGADRKGAAIEKFKQGMQKAITPANLLKNAVGFIADKLNEAEKAFKEAFIGANSLATKLVETDITFVKETGQARELGKTLEDLKFSATDLKMTTTEMDQSFRGLTQGYQGFALVGKANQQEMTKQAVAFERLGIKSDVLGKSVQQLVVGFNKAPKAAMAIADDIRKFSQAVGMGADGLNQFNANMDLLVTFGEQKGTQVFKNLAMEAQRAGVAIETLRGIGKTFDTFEGAMRSAGKLNFILKGPYLNSMKMLRADDAERIDMLKRAFEESGQTFDDLGRRGKEAIAETLGKSVTDVQKIFSGQAEAEEKAKKSIMERARAMGGLDEEMKKQLTLQQKQELAAEAMVTAFQPLAEVMHSIQGIFADIKRILAPLTTVFGGLTAAIKPLIPIISMLIGAKGLGGLLKTFLKIPGLAGKAGSAALKAGGKFAKMGSMAMKAGGLMMGALGVFDAYNQAKEAETTGEKVGAVAQGALSGAMAGAAFGPLGAGVGALVGGGLSAIGFLNEGTDNFNPMTGDIGMAVTGDAPGGKVTPYTEISFLNKGSSVLNSKDAANLTTSVRNLPQVLENLATVSSNMAQNSSLATSQATQNNTATRIAENFTQPIVIKLELDRGVIAEVAKEVSVDVVNRSVRIS
jgi:hypothetical protein